MHAEPAHDHVLAGRTRGHGIAIGVDLYELASGDEPVKAVVEFTALLPVQAQFPGQLLESGCVFGLLRDLFQDGRVRKHEREVLQKLSHK